MKGDDPDDQMETGTQPSSPPAGSAGLDPQRWVEEHCDELYRYALARVTNPEVARDLVQETFLAAWRSSERFAGKASERTWLVRIMRNKIADHYRKRRPEFGVDGVDELVELEEKQFAQTGLHKGGWASANSPKAWKDAAESLEESEFWEVVHECARKLPAKTASVFLLREVDGRSNEEICATLQMNANHVGVLLHRARLALRRCLELNWFRGPAGF